MTSKAYLLISHGSRDPRHQVAINRLAQLIRERLNPALVSPWSSQGLEPLMAESHAAAAAVLGSSEHTPQRLMSSVMAAPSPMPRKMMSSPALPRDRFIVGTAVLDFGLFPLHQQICEFGRRLSSAGIDRLHLVPLFLLSGKHVMQDIPEQVDRARHELDGLIELEVGNHIGGAEAMPDLIANRFLHSSEAGRLIVAHGSRRVRGNRVVNNLAKTLGTAVAYWTKEDDIEAQAIHLMQQGCSSLTIFPYFLFAGSITDAVAHLTEELAERFPRTNFRLLPPLGATDDLANLVVGTLGHNALSHTDVRTEEYVL